MPKKPAKKAVKTMDGPSSFEILTRATVDVTVAAIAKGVLRDSKDIQSFLLETYETVAKF